MYKFSFATKIYINVRWQLVLILYNFCGSKRLIMKLNEKLIRLRKKGLTQDELASKLNVSRQAISKWENGNSEPELNNIK